MKRGTKRILAFCLLVIPGLMGLTAFWFLPRVEVPRTDELPDGDLVPYAFAEIQDGGPAHPASGNVTLYMDNETQQWFLYFQGYDATRGRDAWLFLSAEAQPSTRAHVDAGIQLTVPGRGPADARGDFLVLIDDEVDPLAHRSVVTWDLRFDERHAWAPLDPR